MLWSSRIQPETIALAMAKPKMHAFLFDFFLVLINNVFLLPRNGTKPTPTSILQSCFAGSAWTMLSRSFAEYVTMGWDNLPRTLLLYHANIISSPEFYFQTVACNSRRFRNELHEIGRAHV